MEQQTLLCQYIMVIICEVINVKTVGPSSTIVIKDAAALKPNNFRVDINFSQSGTGDASPSNVRPITGYSTINIWNTNKNLFNAANAEVGIAWNGAVSTSRGRVVVPCKPSTKYRISMNGVNNFSNIYYKPTPVVPATDAGGEITNSMPLTITTKADSQYIVFAFSKTTVTQEDIEALNLQLEYGQSNTTYEVNRSRIITITPEQVVYSGYVDMINKELVLEWGSLAMDSINWEYNSSGNRFNSQTLNQFTKEDGVLAVISDCYNGIENISSAYFHQTPDYSITFNSGGSTPYLMVRDTRYTDATEFKAQLANHYMICKYATPITYELSTSDIVLLKNFNTIYSNAGDITLTYNPVNYDKIVDSAQLESELTATADAIREKTGDSSLIPWEEGFGFSNVIQNSIGVQIPSAAGISF